MTRGDLTNAFSKVRMPGLETPYEQQIYQEIKVRGDRLAVDAKCAREIRCVQKSRLMMCKHGPETSPKFQGGNTWTKERNIAFQIGANKSPAAIRWRCTIIRSEETCLGTPLAAIEVFKWSAGTSKTSIGPISR